MKLICAVLPKDLWLYSYHLVRFSKEFFELHMKTRNFKSNDKHKHETPQRKYPASIKFSKTSSSCHKLAERISSVISREYELFHQAGKNDCTLLLLDRRDDVTTVSILRKSDLPASQS